MNLSALNLLLWFSLLLPSCMVGPDYEPPEITVPDAWTESIDKDNKSKMTGSQKWWKRYKDPVLDELIKRSREANPNIRIARARISESWYQRSVLSAAWYPKAEINARDAHGLGTFDSGGVKWDIDSSRDQYANFDVGWELDIFGRVSRQVESATAEYEAKIEGYRDALVFINSEVALHYIAYRTLEKRIAVAEEGRDSYRNIKVMIDGRFEEGLSTKMEQHEANADLLASEAEIPKLKQEKKVISNRLAALVAMRPAEMPNMLKPGYDIPSPPKRINAGYPSEILRSRPDIRRAERKIESESARIGVATANLYPQFSLSGAISYEYFTQGATIETLTRTLGLGPNVRWRLFNACADRNRIREQESKLEQAITVYEGTVINAVTQVENSMTRIHHSKKRLQYLQKATKEYYGAASLLYEAYQTGQVDLRRLLNSQQDYIRTKDECYATEGRHVAHSVRLFKALGGGELPQPKSTALAN
ncbi:efflux transporter outer membrane subunit [Rubritalea sp.]|uniref:efflux transporter outer membrane subunit n=1 Tax=Rubritalea sp. TaxID=2109375 RepID=UPI003EF85A3E